MAGAGLDQVALGEEVKLELVGMAVAGRGTVGEDQVVQATRAGCAEDAIADTGEVHVAQLRGLAAVVGVEVVEHGRRGTADGIDAQAISGGTSAFGPSMAVPEDTENVTPHDAKPLMLLAAEATTGP